MPRNPLATPGLWFQVLASMPVALAIHYAQVSFTGQFGSAPGTTFISDLVCWTSYGPTSAGLRRKLASSFSSSKGPSSDCQKTEPSRSTGTGTGTGYLKEPQPSAPRRSQIVRPTVTVTGSHPQEAQ